MTASPSFAWPDGKRAAVSLSFDDTRYSQLEVGLPILDRHGVKATFYATLRSMEGSLERWCQASANGHEIGNHTVSHPCSGNFLWSRAHALEDYTLEQMEAELVDASARIEEWTGRPPATFAYPCGQKFVGRGAGVQSYVGLVAKHFLVGRGFREEAVNDPTFCDLAQITGIDFDGLSVAAALQWLERAEQQGGWLVFAGHDVGESGVQTVLTSTLDAVCRYCQDPVHGLWLTTVEQVGAYVGRA